MSENIGGQALIEGVMIKKGDCLVKAVRKDGEIIVEESAWESSSDKFRKIPFVRGAFILFDSIKNGLKALRWSSDIIHNSKENKDSIFSDKEIIFAILLTFGLFFALPHIITTILLNNISGFAFHGIIGLLKLSIFLIYIWLISFNGEVKRIFGYHGAEHKVVNAYEAGQLDLKEAYINTRFSRFHTRCGTSFMFIVLMVSIILFSLIFGPLSSTFIAGNIALTTFFLILLKVPLLIPIAGISYEIFMFAAKNSNKWWSIPFLLPGMIIQRLTTKEPTTAQVEVAKTALMAALKK